LVGAVVWVLTGDDDFDCVKRRVTRPVEVVSYILWVSLDQLP
jgi:hypothetical protein